MSHSAGYPGNEQDGTLPLPEMFDTETPVPDGVRVLL